MKKLTAILFCALFFVASSSSALTKWPDGGHSRAHEKQADVFTYPPCSQVEVGKLCQKDKASVCKTKVPMKLKKSRNGGTKVEF